MPCLGFSVTSAVDGGLGGDLPGPSPRLRMLGSPTRGGGGPVCSVMGAKAREWRALHSGGSRWVLPRQEIPGAQEGADYRAGQGCSADAVKMSPVLLGARARLTPNFLGHNWPALRCTGWGWGVSGEGEPAGSCLCTVVPGTLGLSARSSHACLMGRCLSTSHGAGLVLEKESAECDVRSTGQTW